MPRVARWSGVGKSELREAGLRATTEDWAEERKEPAGEEPEAHIRRIVASFERPGGFPGGRS